MTASQPYRLLLVFMDPGVEIALNSWMGSQLCGVPSCSWEGSLAEWESSQQLGSLV